MNNNSILLKTVELLPSFNHRWEYPAKLHTFDIPVAEYIAQNSQQHGEASTVLELALPTDRVAICERCGQAPISAQSDCQACQSCTAKRQAMLKTVFSR